MNLFSIVVDIILAAYIMRECISFVPRYRRFKQEVASGDPQARTRLYREALIFAWLSAGLAAIALRFDWRTLNPNSLGLDGSGLLEALTPAGGFNKGFLLGGFFAIVTGTIAMVVFLMLRNRRGGIALPSASASRWRRLMPDFAALAPVTKRERLLWVLVALSAGICEEIVFRGWLLFSLHNIAGLQGTLLLATAAAIFGLAHAYQKITGVILTTFVGLLLCVLYFKTGSLLVPIVLHCLIDLKLAILPAPRPERTATAYA
jgi:uncharacterized protein